MMHANLSEARGAPAERDDFRDEDGEDGEQAQCEGVGLFCNKNII